MCVTVVYEPTQRKSRGCNHVESHHRFIFMSNIYRSLYHIVTFRGLTAHIYNGQGSAMAEMNGRTKQIQRYHSKTRS